MKMVRVAAGADKSSRSLTECPNHFPVLSSLDLQRVGRVSLVQPGGATRVVTSHVFVQSLDSDTSSTTSEENLSFTVFLCSGRSSVFQGFSYDDRTSKLEACVLSWISDIQDIHQAFLKIELKEGERVLDTHQTFTKNELTDGMEITAIVSPDGPPPLLDSSDTDNE